MYRLNKGLNLRENMNQSDKKTSNPKEPPVEGERKGYRQKIVQSKE